MVKKKTGQIDIFFPTGVGLPGLYQGGIVPGLGQSEIHLYSL